MPNIRVVSKTLNQRLGKKQDALKTFAALMGRGDGEDPRVAGREGYVWVRVGHEQSVQMAYNTRVMPRDDLAIYVGYVPEQPDLLQVISIRQEAYVDSGQGFIPPVIDHHQTHEYGGGDDVYVEWRRIMGFRVGRPNGFYVYVDPGVMHRDGAWHYFPERLVYLGDHVPGAGALYVLIYMDADGNVQHTVGTAVASVAVLRLEDCPVEGNGEMPLAAVRLYVAQAEIGDTPTNPDIIDLRFPQNRGAAGGAAAGNDTNVQFNDGGAFGGSDNLIWDDTRLMAQIDDAATNTVVYPLRLSHITSNTAATGFGVGLELQAENAGGNNAVAATVEGLWKDATNADEQGQFKVNVMSNAALGEMVVITGGMYTIAAGNARGQHSVEIQAYRVNATEVSSGALSTVVGNQATASNIGDTALGIGAIASGSYCVAIARATASGAASVCIGGNPTVGNNVVSGDYSVCVGGSAINISGQYSANVGGSLNDIDGDYSVGMGRRAHIAAAHDGSFMFADHTDADFNSVAAGEAAFRVRGGFRIAYDDSNYWQVLVGAAIGIVPWTMCANAAGYLYNDGAGNLSYGAPAGLAHNLLSVTHSDTLAAAVARGSIIVGNATPKWAALAKGTANSVVTCDANDTIYSSYYITGTAGGTTTLAVTNTKTLTLTATDNYNLTIAGSPTLSGNGTLTLTTNLTNNGANGAITWNGAYTMTVPGTGTVAIATGLAGGQTIYGGTAANDDLTLSATSHITKTTSYINLTDATLVGVTAKIMLRPDYAGLDDLVAGSFIGADSSGGLNIIPDDNGAASTLVIAAFNGTNWRSMAQTASVAAGEPNLLLVKSAGNVGIGMSTAPGSKLVISSNSAALPAATAGTMLHLGNADSTVTRILIDSYAQTPNMSFRHSQGTAASPSASQNNNVLGNFTWYGYGATGYGSTATAMVAAYAAENWTDAAQGSYMTFGTTPTGSATRAERMRITAGGNLLFGTSTDFASSGAHVKIVGGLSVGGDNSGVASYTSFTNATNTTVTNTYLVKGGQAANTVNTGWIKIYVGTNAAWVPYWQNATP